MTSKIIWCSPNTETVNIVFKERVTRKDQEKIMTHRKRLKKNDSKSITRRSNIKKIYRKYIAKTMKTIRVKKIRQIQWLPTLKSGLDKTRCIMANFLRKLHPSQW